MNNILLTLLCTCLFGVSCADETQFSSNLRNFKERSSKDDLSNMDNSISNSQDAEEGYTDDSENEAPGENPDPINNNPIPVAPQEPPKTIEEIRQDEAVSIKPGDEVANLMLGVNYDDNGGGDNDHNDAVVCLRGAFKINQSTGVITSLKDQGVDVATRKNADLNQTIEITGVDVMGGSRRIFKHLFLYNADYSDPLYFYKGEQVTISFTTQGNHEVQAPSAQVKFEKDHCRE